MRAILLLAVVLTACGTRPSKPELRPSPVPTGDVFRPHGPPVEQYGADGPGTLKGVAAAIGDLAQRLRPEVQTSAALSATARSVVDEARPGVGVDPGVLRFVANYHGVFEPVTSQLVAQFTVGIKPKAVAKAMKQALGAALAAGKHNQIGIAIGPAKAGIQRVVVLLSSRRLGLSPVPRAVQAGSQIDVAAHLDGAFTKASVYVTRADGNVDQIDTKLDGQSLRAAVECVGYGEHRIEILAEKKQGPEVLANFPVWCGVTPPSGLAVASPDVGPMDARRAELRLFALTNEARKKAGLPTLKWSEGAARVARGHSLDMANNGFFAHVSPTTGTVGDRVRAAEIDSPTTMENLGLGVTPDAVHQGLMESPGHRAAILAVSSTRVGIGVVHREKAGSPQFHATQVFLSDRPPFVPKAVAAKLRAQIAARAKVPPDARLDRFARVIAGQIARGEIKGDRIRVVTQNGLKRRAPKYAGAKVATVVGDDPSGIAEDRRLFPKGSAGYGVGAAVSGSRRVVVVMIGLR